MSIPIETLSEDDVESLARMLHTSVTDTEAAAFAEQINNGLHWYETLDSYGHAGTEANRVHPTDLQFNPGAKADPLNAFISKFSLRDTASEDGILSGLSVAVKDNTAVAGVPLTCGSRIFESVIPRQNATVVDRLLDEGAEIVGKTNMDELAYGPTGETSQFGPTRHPMDRNRVSGGSSSGSGATVGAGTVDAALGSDTGGSVRIPAAFCGVVGMKPSWGVVPRSGVVELAYTLDHVGSLATDVETTAAVLDAITGRDDRDLSSVRAEFLSDRSFRSAVENPPDLKELTIGVPEEFFAEDVEDGVAETIYAALGRFEEAGVTVTETSIPTVEDAVAVSNAIMVSEFAAAIRSRGIPFQRNTSYDTVLQDALATALSTHGHKLGDIVKRKMVEGEYLLDRYQGRHYVRAKNARRRLETEFEAALDETDVLVTPTLPTVATELGEWSADGYGENVPLAVNTRPINLVGLPAVTLPAGTHDDLPVGLQCIGSTMEDISTLAIARTFERALETTS
ncbi:amidase [Natronomonas sp.]|uniref:amidase n=1 Tax=Natronomonas sp. TaxID=2184060 RepID=UPI0039759EB0